MRITLIILILPTLLCGQKNSRVGAYFLKINKAESNIMTENWGTASIIYEEAFNETINPFFSDVVNYLNCLILSEESGIKKIRKLTYWINYLINEKGVKWEYLEDNLFPDFLLREYKKDFCYTQQKDSLNMIADSMLLQIFIDDQNVRPKKARYTKEDKIAIDSMDQVNWKRFNEFIHRFGFPCEQNVSISLGEYEIWSVISLLLRHFVQDGYGEEVIAILQKEFQALKIPRNIIGSVYDLEYHMSGGDKKHYNYVTTYITFIGANIYKPLINYSEESIALINQNRLSIYLPEMETSLMNSVCKTMCVKGKVKKFFIEPYVYMDNLPSFLFENDEDQQLLNKMKIEPVKYVVDCPCETF